MIDRREWIDLNLITFEQLFDRIEQIMASQAAADTPGRALARIVNRSIGNQQLGFLMAFLARKVLGQYDISLLAASPSARGRLHFVEPNIRATAAHCGCRSTNSARSLPCTRRRTPSSSRPIPGCGRTSPGSSPRRIDRSGRRFERAWASACGARSPAARRALAGAHHVPRPAATVPAHPGAHVPAGGLLEPRHERRRRAILPGFAEIHERFERRNVTSRTRSSGRSCASPGST